MEAKKTNGKVPGARVVGVKLEPVPAPAEKKPKQKPIDKSKKMAKIHALQSFKVDGPRWADGEARVVQLEDQPTYLSVSLYGQAIQIQSPAQADWLMSRLQDYVQGTGKQGEMRTVEYPVRFEG